MTRNITGTEQPNAPTLIDNGTMHQGRLNMEDRFTQTGVYEHGIATYALGEYFNMTQDERVAELLRQAISHIVQGQGPGGGWMYPCDKTANDLSASGWQIQALKAAHLTKLNLPGAPGCFNCSNCPMASAATAPAI